MVVAHSWGGCVLPLVAAWRPVSLLVYLCARLATSRADEPSAYVPGAFEGIEERPNGSRVVVDPSHMHARVPSKAATRAAAALRPQYWPEPPELDVRAHPRAYVLCRDDEFAPLEWSRWAARELLGVEPVELQGGYFPMVEQPPVLADVLCALADVEKAELEQPANRRQAGLHVPPGILPLDAQLRASRVQRLAERAAAVEQRQQVERLVVERNREAEAVP